MLAEQALPLSIGRANKAKKIHFQDYGGSVLCFTERSEVLQLHTGMYNNIRTKWVCRAPDVERPRAEARTPLPIGTAAQRRWH